MEYNLNEWTKNFLPLLNDRQVSLEKSKLATPRKIGTFILDHRSDKILRKYIVDILKINRSIKMINQQNEVILGVTKHVYSYLKLELPWVFDTGITIRQVDVKRVTYKETQIINEFKYNEGKYYGDEYIYPDDKMKNFIDLDLWLFMGNRMELPIAPIKNYWVYCDNLEMRKLDEVSMRNIKHAEVLFVNNPYDKEVLEGGLGVNPKRIYQLPYSYYTSKEAIQERVDNEGYHLIICKEMKFEEFEHSVINCLERKIRYGNLKQKVKILTDAEKCTYLKKIINQNKTIKNKIYAVDAIDEYDYINTIRRAKTVTVYPTCEDIVMDIITAIEFNKEIYTLITPVTKYLEEYFNCQIHDYHKILDPRESISNERLLEDEIREIDEKQICSDIKVVLEKLL